MVLEVWTRKKRSVSGVKWDKAWIWNHKSILKEIQVQYKYTIDPLSQEIELPIQGWTLKQGPAFHKLTTSMKLLTSLKIKNIFQLYLKVQTNWIDVAPQRILWLTSFRGKTRLTGIYTLLSKLKRNYSKRCKHRLWRSKKK